MTYIVAITFIVICAIFLLAIVMDLLGSPHGAIRYRISIRLKDFAEHHDCKRLLRFAYWLKP